MPSTSQTRLRIRGRAGCPGPPSSRPMRDSAAGPSFPPKVACMDDYSKEISDLTAQIEQMVEEEADKVQIADLSMQLEILKLLYNRAIELYTAGERDLELRH